MLLSLRWLAGGVHCDIFSHAAVGVFFWWSFNMQVDTVPCTWDVGHSEALQIIAE